MPIWEGFEEDRGYVLDQLRHGFVDYVEVLSYVAETRFFEYLLSQGHIDTLAGSYPTPRRKEEVPLTVYIASELALRLHGATGFSAYPFVIHAGGLKEALRQARFKYDPNTARGYVSCEGYNSKNVYDRCTPCDQDFLRKLAKDTDASGLMNWFGSSAPKLYQKMGMIDTDGIFIVDGSNLFVADNPGYEKSAVGLFDRHNHHVSNKECLTPEDLKRCRWRRYYGSVSLLHTDRLQRYFLYAGQMVLEGSQSENPAMWPLLQGAINALGTGKVKILVHDRGFIDGHRTGKLKQEYGIDSVFPLKAGMLDWEDAKRLADVDAKPWQQWRPEAVQKPPEPKARPESIRRRENKRQQTIQQKREISNLVKQATVERVELKGIKEMKLWESCTVPIHVVLLKEYWTDGRCLQWALATTKEFSDPLQIWQLYKLRPSIEERHRQLKCFWDLTHFRSRAFSMVTNQVIFSVLTYSLMQLFLMQIEREELSGITRQRLLDQLLPYGQRVCVFRDNYIGYFTPAEYSEELLMLSEGPRRRLIGTMRRLRRNSFSPPQLPLRP